MGSYMSYIPTIRKGITSPEVNTPTVSWSEICRICIIYHDRDWRFVTKTLIPLLRDAEFECCTLEDNPVEQKIFQNYENILRNTDKLLCVLSLEFKNDSFLTYLASLGLRRLTNNNVICLRLVPDVCLEDDLACLARTKIVEFGIDDWETELVRKIRYKRPHYSHFLGARNVSQSLQQRGLDLPLMLFNVYGVIVELRNETLRIDMAEFLQHSREHSALGITKVCGECSVLCTPDTTVSLIYDNDSIETNIDLTEFDNTFASLCGNIIDVSSLRQAGKVFILGCTLHGRLADQDYVRKLYTKTRFQITTEKSPNDKIRFPEYADEKKRFESFPVFSPKDRVPKTELLAAAGFFCSGAPLFTTCFACGRFVISWREDDNPWVTHAALNQACPFVKQHQTDEFIKNAKAPFHASKNRINETYRSLEARVRSFDAFSLDKMPQDRATSFDRKPLIYELAEAGFNYTGCGDAFSCYSCGLVLTSISQGEHMMATHARLSPKCAHVIDVKGQDYIRSILYTAGHSSPRTTVSFMIKKLDNGAIPHTDVFLFPPSQSKP